MSQRHSVPDITFSALHTWQSTNYCGKLFLLIYLYFLNDYIIKYKTYPYNLNIHCFLKKNLFITFYNRDLHFYTEISKYFSKFLIKNCLPTNEKRLCKAEIWLWILYTKISQFVWLGHVTVLREHHHKWESINWRKWWDMVHKGPKGLRVWSYARRKFSEME